MKTKALLGVIVLVVMPVVIAYLFMQRDQPDTDNPTTDDAVVAVAPRPAPPPGGGPISGDKVSLETATSRSPYSIPLPSLEGVDWQLSDIWVAEEGRPPEAYQVALRYSNGLEISLGASFGWNSLDDISNLNVSEPFRLTTVNENNARGKDAGVSILIDGTRAPYPASVSWVANDVDIALYHDSWSMERLKEIAESMPSPTWKPGIHEATHARLIREGSIGNTGEDDDNVPPPAHRPEDDEPGPDQENPGEGSTGNTDPVNDALVAVVPRPAPPAGGGPISGDKVSLETATSRSPYSIPIPSLEGVDRQLSGVWVSEEGMPPEFYQVYLIFSNELRISMGGSFGWSPFDDISDLNVSGPFRLTTVNERNARGKDAGVKTLSDGRTRAAYPASLSWHVNDVRISMYHDTWSMERLKEIAESMPSPTWKPGIHEATHARLIREGSIGNTGEDDDNVPPPAHRPEDDEPGPDQENPGEGSTGNASQ